MESFVLKALYLILAVVIVSLFVNRIVFTHSSSFETTQTQRLVDTATDILEKLVGNSECLAYVENATVNGQKAELEAHFVVDKNKLESFSSKFYDAQPDCAKSFDYGYRVEIKEVNANFSFFETIEEVGGVFKKVLKIIDGKSVLFVIDVSGSMSNPGGKFCEDRVAKYQCVSLFLLGKEPDNAVNICHDVGFIPLMSPDSEVALMTYTSQGSNCYIDMVVEKTKLDGEEKRRQIVSKVLRNLRPKWGTPLIVALKHALEYASKNNMDTIVLLTDGYDNSHRSDYCGEGKVTVETLSKRYGKYGITVHTIGFGHADESLLRKIAKEFHGEFFNARSCEELISIIKKKKEEVYTPKSWLFGDKQFSFGESLKQKVTTIVPVVVRYNDTFSMMAKAKITLVAGELETLRGFVDSICRTSKQSWLNITLHNKVFSEGSKICMSNGKTKVCQKAECEIKMKSIEVPGFYRIKGSKVNNMVVLKA